ncbi:MAG: FtsX-like permease family protein [Oscillospiraceae bacterium]|nr:FtsX-like permease family protein [Oscillospiraceae bacterium]
MLMLIWNNIARRRTQSTLTVTITALTVMVFVMVMGIFQTVNQGLSLSRERLGADAILIPKYSNAKGDDLLFTAMPENIYMPIEVVEQAKQLDGMAAMSPQFYCQTLALGCCDPGEEARIIGYDPETDFILKPYLPDEHKNGINQEQLIIGHNYLDDDLVGYNYMILGRIFKVVTALEPTGTGMDSTFFMDWRTAQDMCLESEVLRQDWTKRDPHDYISVIMVKFEEGTDPDAFVRQVEESGMEAKCLLTGETISSLQSQLEVTMKVMFALWLASLLIAVLSLVGRFNALAKERKKEIGLLRAIGLKKGQVFGLIIGETCTMALMGGILGSGIALLCMDPVIEALKNAFKLSPSVWTTSLALLCGAAGVVLAVLLGFAAAVTPAWKSASMDPQAAITQGEVN